MSTKYSNHNFNLSENQIKSIQDCIKSNEPIILKLSKKSFIDGNIPLPLTKAEEMNVKKNKGFHYNLNKSKIKLLDKDGGFIPI